MAFDEGAWRHIVGQHPEMTGHRADILDAIVLPEHRELDPRAGRERFWRAGVGPSR